MNFELTYYLAVAHSHLKAWFCTYMYMYGCEPDHKACAYAQHLSNLHGAIDFLGGWSATGGLNLSSCHANRELVTVPMISK